ncbi:MAG: glycosyltransferase family 4 protein, partial [Acetobacteraceae bacterium]
MRVLITNTVLAGRSGTEIFAAQLAEELFRRGHQPVLYAPLLGETALALRRAGIPAHDRVAEIAPAPDVIHAHHVGPALAAIAAFPGVPALFVAHDATREQDRPPAHPQIRRVLAVSRAAAEQWGGGALLRNAVDLARFPPRPPLPARPSRLLVVAKHAAGVQEALAAAARAGLAAEALGHALGRVTADLPAAFAAADIVVASGRSALEAAASGCAVILAEGGRFGGMLDAARLDALLDDNLGLRTLRAPLTPAALDAAITAFDPADVAAVAA